MGKRSIATRKYGTAPWARTTKNAILLKMLGLPQPLHDASFRTVSGAVGDTLTTVPNAGTNTSPFTFISTREFTVGQRYGIKTGLAANTSAMVPPTFIPVSGSYSVVVAVQASAISANGTLYSQYKTTTIDVLCSKNATRHNGAAVPANGFNFTQIGTGGLEVVVFSYDATTGISSVYVNGVLSASGAVPARSGTITTGTVNNASGALGANGIVGDYLAFKISNVALSSGQALKATNDIRALYGNVPFSRFIGPNAQKSYAVWSDSMGNTPNSTDYLPAKLGALYTPSAFVQPGGVNGDTSTQVKTRFLASTIYRDKTTVFWCGRNNPSNPAIVIADIDAMIAALDDPTRYIVISPCVTVTENAAGPGNATYDQIKALQAALLAQYGAARYLDVESIVLANNYDGQHPNAAGTTLIAPLVKAKFDAMGW